VANDRIDIKPGISIGGVEEAKAALASIRAPIDSLISQFRELGEAIGAAFAVAKPGDLGKQNWVQYLDFERETITATQRAAASRAAAEKRAADEAQAYWHLDEMGRDAQRRINETWNRIAEPVERNIGGALSDAVLGIRQRGGIGRIELDIGRSLVGGVMNNLVKGIGDSLFKPLFASLLPQGGILGGLGNLLFGTGRDQAKISLLTLIATNTGIIAGNTGVTAASTGTSAIGTGFGAIGAFSGIRSIFGWIGGLFGFAQGGIVPSAAGGWSLPSFAGAMPALLHSQEMVLPADLSQGLQNMIRSGAAGDVHVHLGFHGPADGASIGRWFGQNRGDLAQAIRSAWDSGALSLP
jgi:hypothetical protein